MTLRRIHTEQGRTPLGSLEQKQPTPDVAILEGLVAKGLLQLVELNQLQRQRTTPSQQSERLNLGQPQSLPAPGAKLPRPRFESPAITR